MLSSIKSILIIIIFVPLLSCSSSQSYYVSLEGNDANSGTKEKPFASLERVQEIIRKRALQGNRKKIEVYMDSGTYYLQSPLSFLVNDSKDVTYPEITFEARNEHKTILSGGFRLESWTFNDSLHLWQTSLNGVEKSTSFFRELFVDGQRAVRARHPNDGFLRIAKTGEDHRTNFYFHAGDFPIPAQPKNTELVFFHDWSITRVKIDQINDVEHLLTACDTIGAKVLDFFTIDHWEQNPRYYLENDLTFLDMDYEWFLDSSESIVYLKLPAEINPNQKEVVAPNLTNLVVISGTADKPVRNITFKGIDFTHCAYLLPADRYGGIQACHHDYPNHTGGWSFVPGAISVQFAENIGFEQCSFQHLGGSGLHFGTSANQCLVRNSIFADISGNGIMIGEGQDREVEGIAWWKKNPDQVASGNIVDQCTVHDIGQQFFGAVGIWAGLTSNTTIRDNTVYNLPYSGISVGWMWNSDTTPCENNRIEGNHIHHIMQTLSDGGGIYMLGRQPDSKILSNLIHDVHINVGRAESNGMFIDEGSTDILIEANFIYHIAKSPLRFHRAGVNEIRNNFLFTQQGIEPIRYNNTPKENIHLVDNTMISDAGDPAIYSILTKWSERVQHFQNN